MATTSNYSAPQCDRLRAILESWTPEEMENSTHLPEEFFREGMALAVRALSERGNKSPRFAVSTEIPALRYRVEWPNPRRYMLADRILPPDAEQRYRLSTFIQRVLLERLRRCLLDLLRFGERIPVDLAGGNDFAEALGVSGADYNDALEALHFGNVAVMWEGRWQLRTSPDGDAQ